MNISLLRRKEQLTFPILRVDDRLLHGQVVVGWGQSLELRPVILVSDRVHKDTPLAETLRGLVPPEQEGDILPLADAAERWASGAFTGKRALLVVESAVDALKLARLGAPVKALTLGGLHFREGRDEILPYVFLSEWDRTALAELRSLGVRIVCQDLPPTKPVIYEG